MTIETPITVRYAETDAQRVAHHANYLIWFEEGRSDALRLNGLNYSDFERAGYFLVVAEVQVKYKAPVFYEEKLVIETTLDAFRGSVVKFSYRVIGPKGEVRSEGKTVHVVVGPDKRPTVLPEAMVEQLKSVKGV